MSPHHHTDPKHTRNGSWGGGCRCVLRDVRRVTERREETAVPIDTETSTEGVGVPFKCLLMERRSNSRGGNAPVVSAPIGVIGYERVWTSIVCGCVGRVNTHTPQWMVGAILKKDLTAWVGWITSPPPCLLMETHTPIGMGVGIDPISLSERSFLLHDVKVRGVQ